MSNEILVKVDGVRKKFCRSLKKSLWYGMTDMTAELFGGSRQHDILRPDEFWAVDGVSFELKRGECLGLIGRNGAGKTTLLKMLNGLIKPDHGRIEMRGRVGAFIALGAGFNPILSGRENIYVNGSVLGLTNREINSKIDEIIDFAEIREFIDAPVQSYSSGMQVRLGFAVATALDPDVLILDEVLAVGDAAFRNKCYSRIGELQKRASVIFVSHSMEHIVQICTQGLLLQKGRVVCLGDISTVISGYNSENSGGQTPDKPMEIIREPLKAVSIAMEKTLNYGENLKISINVESKTEISQATVNVFILSATGQRIFGALGVEHGVKFTISQGHTCVTVDLGPLFLSSEKYFVTVDLGTFRGLERHYTSYLRESIFVKGPSFSRDAQVPQLKIVQEKSSSPA